MAGDILKGIAAMIVAALIFGYDQKHLLLFTGVGAVLGHNFPFYMGFRGGKGVAVTIGIMACMDWRILLIAGSSCAVSFGGDEVYVDCIAAVCHYFPTVYGSVLSGTASWRRDSAAFPILYGHDLLETPCEHSKAARGYRA